MMLVLVALSKELQNINQNIMFLEQSEHVDLNNANNKRRNLSINSNLSQIVVSGLSDFEVWETKVITAVPLDSSNNAIGGGCEIYIQVSNQCILNVYDHMCYIDNSAEDVVSTTTSMMAYNNDGQSYSYAFTVDKAGPMSIFVYAYESRHIRAIYYHNEYWAGFGTIEMWSMLNLPFGLNPFLAGGTTEYFSYTFDTYIIGPTNETVDFYIEYDDGIEILIDGVLQPLLIDGETVNDTLSSVGLFNASFSYNMNQNQLYKFNIRWKNVGGSYDKMMWYWSYTGQSQIIIPSTSYHFPLYTGPTVINSFCPTGYSLDANNCVEICGDGIKVGNEACDDGNVKGGDGCASDCVSIEQSWVCSGGDQNASDICTYCNNSIGWYQNDVNHPTECVTNCGDGLKNGLEVCDDGNTENGDGCSKNCSAIEYNFVCFEGSLNSADICIYCTSGYYPNTNQDQCEPICGDGLKVSEEQCEDNNIESDDGCSSICAIETSYACNGGNPNDSYDQCVYCNETEGMYQNDINNSTECIPQCGDGKKAGGEKCDDGNIDNSDGCNSDCDSFTQSWVCRGGNQTTLDTCEYCDSSYGWYQNDANNPTECIPQCGDDHETGIEKCDDGNTENGDGCNVDCTSVEDGWVCINGSETSADTCTKCEDGYHQNNDTNPEYCVPICGDGFKVETEECDDGNTDDGDGCSSTCTIEDEDTIGPIYEPTASTTTAQVVSNIGVCVGFLIAILNSSLVQYAWVLIHFPQILLILPLIATSISKKVQEFIVSNALSVFSVYSLPLRELRTIPLIRKLSFDQPDEYLRILGWSSGSAFVNNLFLIILLIFLVIVHLFLLLIHYLTKHREDRFSLIVFKIYNFFTFTLYIRIFIEIYMFTVLMILSEIKYYIMNGGDEDFGHEKEEGEYEKPKGNYVSLFISCALLLLPFLFLLFVFISWWKNRDNIEIDENCKTRELYNGILKVPKTSLNQQTQNEDERSDTQISETASGVPKDVKIARLYTLLFLIRRLVMIIFVVLIPDSCFAFKAALLLILQSIYIFYGILNRSFIEYKEQVIEALNEFIFLVLIVLLNQYRSESNWTVMAEDLYIGIILSQLWILLIVSVITGTMKLVKFARKCRRVNPQEAQSENRTSEVNNSADIDVSINGQEVHNMQIIHRSSDLFNERSRANLYKFEEEKEKQ